MFLGSGNLQSSTVHAPGKERAILAPCYQNTVPFLLVPFFLFCAAHRIFQFPTTNISISVTSSPTLIILAKNSRQHKLRTVHLSNISANISLRFVTFQYCATCVGKLAPYQSRVFLRSTVANDKTNSRLPSKVSWIELTRRFKSHI
jgi:hypothetical protein